MTYTNRHAEKTFAILSEMFGAVLVTGARQVGKSTMLEHLTEGIPLLSFDDAAVISSATDAPGLFFEYNKPPVFLDEIQKAPDLFPQMKLILDRSKKKGQFFLSGSQQFEMMENVSESLSGRIGIINLLGISMREENGDVFDEPFTPTPSYFSARTETRVHKAPDKVWARIWRGSMPELLLNPKFDWSKFYGAYLRTYIERDVRQIIQATDLMKFQTFMSAAAARTGGLLNLSDMAKDVGISQPTAQSWLSVLLATNIVYLLRPYHTNLTKRAVKTPKMFFLDTGLAAYLTKWTTPDVLAGGAMSGEFFETFVVSEILKSYYNTGELDLPLYFYRDKEKNEIDLLIIKDGIAHPLEIKKTTAPNSGDISSFKLLDKLEGVRRGHGGVICFSDKLLPISGTDTSIPISYL
ncbi:MAG: ATP-binding protein [Clostridiales Family XIII bacterium]|jgi:predicted AAA+ superfamily ATPase|nr:ATP-binding protein [Clostridiales Family XIII bacterium]